MKRSPPACACLRTHLLRDSLATRTRALEVWSPFFLESTTKQLSKQADIPIRERLCEALNRCNVAMRAASDRLARNIRHLGTALGMSVVDRRLFRLAALRWLFEPLEQGMAACGRVHRYDACRLLAVAINSNFFMVDQSIGASSSLRASGLMVAANPPCGVSDFLRLPVGIAEDMIFNAKGAEAVLQRLCRVSAPAKLTRQDFTYAASEVELVAMMLEAIAKQSRAGMNVLVYGSPGTGKTEFARMVCAEAKYRLLEVPCVDGDDDPLNAERRFRAYWACQRVGSVRHRTAVLFDEAEDVFPPTSKGANQTVAENFRGPRKAWINSMLEGNVVPTIWTSNSIHQIEDSILRRFDLVFELLPPGLHMRRTIINRYLAPLGVSPEVLGQLARVRSLVPAHVERLATVVMAMRASGDAPTQHDAAIIGHHLREFHNLPYSLDAHHDAVSPAADRSTSNIAGEIAGGRIHRLIARGRSDADHRAWARCLAQHLDRDLVEVSVLRYLAPMGPDHHDLSRRLGRAMRANEMILVRDVDSLDPILDGGEGCVPKLRARCLSETLAEFPGLLVIALPEHPELLPACVRERSATIVRLRAPTLDTLWQALVSAAQQHQLREDVGEAHAHKILASCAFESAGSASNAIGTVLATGKATSVGDLLDELQRNREPFRVNGKSRIGFLSAVGAT